MTPSDHIRTMFATFDAKDVPALAAFMTDDVRLRLGNTNRSGSPFPAATCSGSGMAWLRSTVATSTPRPCTPYAVVSAPIA